MVSLMDLGVQGAVEELVSGGNLQTLIQCHISRSVHHQSRSRPGEKVENNAGHRG